MERPCAGKSSTHLLLRPSKESSLLSKECCDDLRQQLQAMTCQVHRQVPNFEPFQAGHDGLSLAMSEISDKVARMHGNLQSKLGDSCVSTILPPKSVAARYGHCLVMQTDAAWKLV